MKKLFPLFAVLFVACSKSTPASSPIPCDPLISYSAKVKPIFIANCTASGCHDGLNYPSLADYTVARDAAQQIRTAVDRGMMPKNNSLSASDKAAILCWIDNGSKNN